MNHNKDTQQSIERIPCSVGILTLNSEKGLPACLESVKAFGEIVVCDGNSTDSTVAIAHSYGARVVKQYDSDEPNLRCVKDKATVRQRNMEAATFDWYFFMDSDDTLSPEVVEEIRSIVTNPHPTHVVYRMPTRIFIEGREIKHEATYPSYQIRLIHKKLVAPHFKGKVHERLVFDEKRFPVGTLKNYYNFQWPKERYVNFWKYSKMYADWELDVVEPRSLSEFLYWGLYRRIRVILGYLFRIPLMYLRYGFKDSMPLHIELYIVRYHLRILFGEIRMFFFRAYAKG